MSPLRPPKTKAEKHDSTLLASGYPNYAPKTPWGRRFQVALTPATHTPVLRQKPHTSIHINS